MPLSSLHATGRRGSLILALVGVTGAVVAPVPGHAAGAGDLRRYLLPEEAPEPKDGAVRVTFLGVSTLLFDDGETRFLIDAFLTRPSLLQLARPIATDPKTVDAALKRAGIDRLAAVFVSHSHYDHALDTAYVVRKTGAKLYGSASTLNIGRGGGLTDEQMVRFEPGRDYQVGQFSVTVLRGRHSPPLAGINNDLGQTIDEPLRQPARFRQFKEGGSFDFLVRRGDRTVYVNPSANVTAGSLRKLRAEVVFLSVGGLDLQSADDRRRFYEETVGFLRPRLVIPVHWDNFFRPLTDRLEGLGNIETVLDWLAERLKADAIRFGLLQGFQSVTLFAEPTGTRP